MNATGSSAIEVEHLFKHYGDYEAVHDLSFTVRPGTCTAVLGPNGAGKTSTIKTLYGKARADRHEGTRIRVLGHDMPSRELEAKSLMGLVPQDNCLDEELDIEQNLWIYTKFHAMSPREARLRIADLLDFMELGEKRKSRVKELSGGMQRRLVIARALLNSPRLIILDEPTTGLDPQVRQMIWDKLRELMRSGVTVLLTTHYMDEAWQIADDIIIMDKGRKVLQGAPRDLMAREMETHVLEVSSPGALEAAEAVRPLPEGLRREQTGSRTLLYSSSESTLAALAASLPQDACVFRQTHLEDLFLKTTGRSLND